MLNENVQLDTSTSSEISKNCNISLTVFLFLDHRVQYMYSTGVTVNSTTLILYMMFCYPTASHQPLLYFMSFMN